MKLKFYPTLVLLVLIFSCSKNDDTIAEDPNLITNVDPTGSYLLTAFNSSIKTNLNKDGVTSTNQMAECSCYDNYKLDLRANGTFYGDNRLAIVTAREGISSVLCEQGNNLDGTYTISGNNITLKFIKDGALQEMKLKYTDNKVLTSEIIKDKLIATSFESFGSIVLLLGKSDIEYVFTKK